jgi:molecular chaperone GrpE
MNDEDEQENDVVSASSHADPTLTQQLAEAREEALTNLNGWKRTQADFDNYQKRKEQENKELIEFAREVAVAKLLPSLDTLEQAFKHAPAELMKSDIDAMGSAGKKFADDYHTWLTGIDGLVKQLDKALEDLGVKKVEAVGKKFDPNMHEAVREVPGDEDGLVVEEYQTGFMLGGKLIRPSQVAISKKQ